MEINIHAGMRILYKQGNSNWLVGTIMEGDAKINNVGLFIPIAPVGINPDEEYHWAEINDIFLDVIPLEDWHKQYKEYFMTKEEYIKFIESEDFDKRNENAYVSDGEYVYYRINKFNESWINKQPFDYIVRYDS